MGGETSSDVGDVLAASQPRLLAYVGRRVAVRADAEDIQQEVFARVLHRARQVGLINPLAYAFRVADNLIRDRARGRPATAEGMDELPCRQARPDEMVETRQSLAAYETALAEMSALRREVFLRRRLHDEAYEQIAEALGMSLEAVQKHYSRAAIALREAMSDRAAGGGRR